MSEHLPRNFPEVHLNVESFVWKLPWKEEESGDRFALKKRVILS